MRHGQHFQSLLDFAIQNRVQEANALHVSQLEVSHTLSAPQIQHLHFNHSVFADFLSLLVHSDGGACLRSRLGGIRLLQYDLVLFAACLMQKLAVRWAPREVNSESLQRAVDGVLRVLTDGADVAAVQISEDHALDEI